MVKDNNSKQQGNSGDSSDSLVFSDEGQKEGAKDTLRQYAISYKDLPYIMAKEKQYAATLSELWKEYQCHLGGPKEPKITTEQDRINTWQIMFRRLFSIDVNGSSLPVPDDKEITLYELKGYFENLGIPLPTKLFHDRESEKIEIAEVLTGEEIMDKYKIKPFQLLYCIKEELTKKWEVDGCKPKLQPYSPVSLQKIHIMLFCKKVIDWTMLPMGSSRIPYQKKPFNPYYDQEVEHVDELLPQISELIFKKVEVEETLIAYGLCQQEKIPTLETAKEKDLKKLIKPKEDESLENPAVIQLVKEAEDEIIIIYDSLKREVGFSEPGNPDLADDLKEEAITTLTDQGYSFKWIREKYLTDLNLYVETLNSRSDHRRRYFRETLLQKIVKVQTGKKSSKPKLRNLLKKI